MSRSLRELVAIRADGYDYVLGREKTGKALAV
jgi:hypothetical protein